MVGGSSVVAARVISLTCCSFAFLVSTGSVWMGLRFFHV